MQRIFPVSLRTWYAEYDFDFTCGTLSQTTRAKKDLFLTNHLPLDFVLDLSIGLVFRAPRFLSKFHSVCAEIILLLSMSLEVSLYLTSIKVRQ